MTYGTVKFWELVTENVDGTIKHDKFRTWEEATDAFHNTAKPEILAAVVYAIESNGWQIETWKRGY